MAATYGVARPGAKKRFARACHEVFDATVNASLPSGLTRRRFLAASLATLALARPARSAPVFPVPALGLCGSIEEAPAGRNAGLGFIEIPLNSTCALTVPEAEFEEWRMAVKEAALPASRANLLFPGDLKVVGPSRDLPRLQDYADACLARAARVGVRIVTWGSGESRRAPEGTSAGRAVEQFTECAREIAAIAGRHGLTIAVEPLNRSETNVLNRLADVCAVVDAINAPNFGATADLYHMRREKEGAEVLVAAGARVRHCHIAEDVDRLGPGNAGDDFSPYFGALKAVGYSGAISFECLWRDFGRELPVAVAEISRQWRESAEPNPSSHG